jgi:hypothetical protein
VSSEFQQSEGTSSLQYLWGGKGQDKCRSEQKEVEGIATSRGHLELVIPKGKETRTESGEVHSRHALPSISSHAYLLLTLTSAAPTPWLR